MSQINKSLSDHERFMDTAHELISSARVEGTPVFGGDGEKIGTIEAVLIHKVTGQATYAVLTFGGLLHRREHVYPLPWSQLTYDRNSHGYVIDLTRDEIEAAPKVLATDVDRLTGRKPPGAFI